MVKQAVYNFVRVNEWREIMRFLLLIISCFFLTACNDEPKEEVKPLTPEQRADNPLIKMQDDTTKKAQKYIDESLEKQKKTLEAIGG